LFSVGIAAGFSHQQSLLHAW